MSQADEKDTLVHEAVGARRAVRARPRLEWTDDGGTHEVVVDRPLLVGSAQRADVVIADATVSRLHAELEPRKGGLWVRDLGSRNGTWLEGIEVASARVPDGGRLRLGAVVLTHKEAKVETAVDLWPGDRFGPLLGRSAAMRELFATLAAVAQLDSTVLVQGETGTGKELVAQAIHEASPRAGGPFVVVDCGALPEQLLQAELFGHARGAFTGATTARAGAIEAAHHGTVFLDEIGELPLAMQPMLLRVVESRSVRRLGEVAHRSFDVRFVTATHRDLRSMVNAGAFREDLYFRLAVLPVTVPPLRQRMDDVAQLIEHFLPNAAQSARDELLDDALDRPWLGNVRELRNVVERALAFGAKQAIAMSPSTFPPPPSSIPPPPRAGTMPPPPSGGSSLSSPNDPSPETSFAHALDLPLREFQNTVERAYVHRLLRRHGGNAAAAAQAAGIDRTYIYRLIKKHEG